MTYTQAISILRDCIGDREEHHSNCNKKLKKGRCDCYAWRREEQHQALDLILEKVAQGNPHRND